MGLAVSASVFKIKVPVTLSCSEKTLDELALTAEEELALFTPQVIELKTASPEKHIVWQRGYMTASVCVTGTAKRGASVVVYAHIPNYFSNPKNAIQAISTGLIRENGSFPQKEFWKLVDSDGQTDRFGNRLVWVVDYEKLRKAKQGIMPVSEMLAHPQTIPFVGSERRAINYLQTFEQHYPFTQIGNWFKGELQEQPMGHLLTIGADYGATSGGFNGGLNSSCSFLTIPGGKVPELEQVLKISHTTVTRR